MVSISLLEYFKFADISAHTFKSVLYLSSTSSIILVSSYLSIR